MVKEIELKNVIKLCKINFSSIPVFKYDRTLKEEFNKGCLSHKRCLELFEQRN